MFQALVQSDWRNCGLCVGSFQKMELHYWWEYSNNKTRINQLNEKPLLILWGLRVPIWKINFCSKVLQLSLHVGSLETCKTLKQKFISQIRTLNPRYQQALFIQLIYSCFLVTIFPPIAQLHFLDLNPHRTHNSPNCSDKGLMLETYPFNSLQWPIYFYHFYSTTVSLETHPLYF